MADDDFELDEKTPNPKLQRRLPRETNCIIIPFDDEPPLMEQAQMILGDRLVETRQGYKLDGRIRNIRDILNAAGLKFKDER